MYPGSNVGIAIWKCILPGVMLKAWLCGLKGLLCIHIVLGSVSLHRTLTNALWGNLGGGNCIQASLCGGVAFLLVLVSSTNWRLVSVCLHPHSLTASENKPMEEVPDWKRSPGAKVDAFCLNSWSTNAVQWLKQYWNKKCSYIQYNTCAKSIAISNIELEVNLTRKKKAEK